MNLLKLGELQLSPLIRHPIKMLEDGELLKLPVHQVLEEPIILTLEIMTMQDGAVKLRKDKIWPEEAAGAIITTIMIGVDKEITPKMIEDIHQLDLKDLMMKIEEEAEAVVEVEMVADLMLASNVTKKDIWLENVLMLTPDQREAVEEAVQVAVVETVHASSAIKKATSQENVQTVINKEMEVTEVVVEVEAAEEVVMTEVAVEEPATSANKKVILPGNALMKVVMIDPTKDRREMTVALLEEMMIIMTGTIIIRMMMIIEDKHGVLTMIKAIAGATVDNKRTITLDGATKMLVTTTTIQVDGDDVNSIKN